MPRCCQRGRPGGAERGAERGRAATGAAARVCMGAGGCGQLRQAGGTTRTWLLAWPLRIRDGSSRLFCAAQRIPAHTLPVVGQVPFRNPHVGHPSVPS